MARCADCDKFLTDVDRAAMVAVNDEYARYTSEVPYDLEDEDAVTDMHCADCIDAEAERAQARPDEDYYAGTINDSTIARIAGNLLSGFADNAQSYPEDAIQRAVAYARQIAAEVERTREDQS